LWNIRVVGQFRSGRHETETRKSSAFNKTAGLAGAKKKAKKSRKSKSSGKAGILINEK